MSKDKNRFIDALTTLASKKWIDIRGIIQKINIKVRSFQAHYNSLKETIDGKSWYSDNKRFIQHQEYPLEASKTNVKALRRIAMDYYLDGEILYKRSFDGILLKSLNEKEVKQAIQEVYKGICATHISRYTMARHIQRSKYLWLTLERDCIDYIKKCQIYVDKINAPSALLFNITSPWPFDICGLNVIGPINPKASNGHRFISVAINYFTKQLEDSYAYVT